MISSLSLALLFKQCTSITFNQVNIPDSFKRSDTTLTGHLTIGDSTTDIGNSAFYECTGLTGLTLGKNVQNIWDNAFADCTGFKGDLIIPNSVLTIKYCAFRNCGFTGKLTIGSKVWEINSGSFAHCKNLIGDLILPDSVTTLYTIFGSGPFRGCTSLNGRLQLSKNIKEIPVAAFAECPNLKGELVIPSSVKIISDSAFYECSGFTGTLELHTTIDTIDDDAFFGCTGISKISYDGKVDPPNFHDKAFVSFTSSQIIVPSDYTSEYFCGILIKKPKKVICSCNQCHYAIRGMLLLYSVILK